MKADTISVPRWFFTEVLFRSRNAAIVLWVLMQKALETKIDTIEASYMDIARLTGLHGPGIQSALDMLVKQGIVKRIVGTLQSDKAKAVKSQYKLIWDVYGEVRQSCVDSYKPLTPDLVIHNGNNGQDIPTDHTFLKKPGVRKIQEILDRGESVRDGRFGEDVAQGNKWYSVGYTKNPAVELAMEKVRSGDIDNLRWRDFYYFFQESYFARYQEHYLEGMKGWVQNILQNLMKKIGNEKLFLIMHWLVNIQTIYKRPTLQLLGSIRHFRVIYEGALAWKRAKENLDAVFKK